jgi:hypothetical protein
VHLVAIATREALELALSLRHHDERWRFEQSTAVPGGELSQLFFFFLTVMAMIFHKTRLQQKLSKSLSHAASSGSMQSKFGMPKGATGQSPVLR